MRFQLHVEDAERDYVLAHDEQICARLQSSLYLLLAELHAADIKRLPIGRGMDGDVVRESAIKSEEAQRKHAETFAPTADDVERQKEIQRAIEQGKREYRRGTV